MAGKELVKEPHAFKGHQPLRRDQLNQASSKDDENQHKGQ